MASRESVMSMWKNQSIPKRKRTAIIARKLGISTQRVYQIVNPRVHVPKYTSERYRAWNRHQRHKNKVITKGLYKPCDYCAELGVNI